MNNISIYYLTYFLILSIFLFTNMGRILRKSQWLPMVLVPFLIIAIIYYGRYSHNHIKIGIVCDYPPFEVMNNKMEPSGLNVNFIEKHLKHNNIQYKYNIVGFSSGIMLLEQGYIDIFAGSVSPTAEREQKYIFIDIAEVPGIMLVINNHQPLRVGVQNGTIWADFVKKNNINHIAFDAYDDIIISLKNGLINSIITNEFHGNLILKHVIKKLLNKSYEIRKIPMKEKICIILRKNNINKFDFYMKNKLLNTIKHKIS